MFAKCYGVNVMRKTPLKRQSAKRKQQLLKENELKQKLFKLQGGQCADCGGACDWRGWEKHEVVFRSQGGDATDEGNCILICAKCHSKRHGIKEVNL